MTNEKHTPHNSPEKAKMLADYTINDIKPEKRHYRATKVDTFVGELHDDQLRQVVYMNGGNGYYLIEETTNKTRHDDVNYVLAFVYGAIIAGISVAAYFLKG